MSEGQIIVQPDRYTRIVAETVQKALTDPDFLMTMRFSSLYENEEFDNALVFSTWHFLFETGLAQMKDYVSRLQTLIETVGLHPPYEIPVDQMFKIDDLIQKFSMYDDTKPVDSKQNIKIIRNYLRAWNQNLGYGVIMYDMHQALLNGRYAEKGGQGRKDVKEITKTILQRDYEVLTSGGNNKDDSGVINQLLRLPRKALGK